MKIAQVAPLYESVPPQFYGGTERVVSYLTEELVKQGHDVTLFASGDSVTAAKLVPVCERALRLDPSCIDPHARHIVVLDEVIDRSSEFDVIHFHTDYMHFPLVRRFALPAVTTLHGRLDIADLAPLYQRFYDIPVVSVSNAQRSPIARANWLGTVYHGIPTELYQFNERPGEYLAFIGRISPEKRLDRAIEIATATGIPLKVAAKVDRVDREYFETQIKPLLDNPLVEYIGEIGDRDKGAFLGGAMAVLFPIDWPEPFGLVMIEAMACGTPVIAFNAGSVPEVIDDGLTGFVVDNVDAAISAVERVSSIDRWLCRLTFDQRFSAARMARDYVNLYASLAVETQIQKLQTIPTPALAVPANGLSG
jgi:glycosyltransferase involved in cell wall biosynthesis